MLLNALHACPAPSLNSIVRCVVTGRRPAHTMVFENDADFRQIGLDSGGLPGKQWVTLPEFFKKAGFTTLGGGKTFHPNHPKDFDVPTSWTTNDQHPYFPFSYYIQPNTSYPSKQPCPGAPPPKHHLGPSPIDVWCPIHEANSHFYDFGLAQDTVNRLQYAASLWRKHGTPFFVMSGKRLLMNFSSLVAFPDKCLLTTFHASRFRPSACTMACT